MVRVVAAAWVRDGRVLAARRGPNQARAGLWELPGGKVEPGEDDRDALRRELTEELGVHADVGAKLAEADHVYPDVTVRLVAYRVACADEPRPDEHAELRWLDAQALGSVAWAPADVPLLGAVADLLG